MIFDEEGTITIVSQEKRLLSLLPEDLKKVYPKIKHTHIIVHLFSFDTLADKEVLGFLEMSNRHRASGKSFVLVSSAFSYEATPQELAIVPTLQEAKDLIAMEEIERDLGI